MYSQVRSENYRMNIDHSPVFRKKNGHKLDLEYSFLEAFHRF